MPKVLLWNKLHTTDTVAFWCSEIPHNHLFSRIINDSNTLPLVGSKDFSGQLQDFKLVAPQLHGKGDGPL